MTDRGWMNFLRGAAFFGGLIAMYTSAQFSVAGFSIDNPDLVWVGWLLAFLIIIVEFTWRKPGMEDNVTMAVVGISAYVFGIITNVRGLMIAMGVSNPMSDVFSFIIAIITGVFLEVMPEPFFSWGLTGKSMADMFGEVQTMMNGTGKPVHHPQTVGDRVRNSIPDEEVMRRLDEFNQQRKGQQTFAGLASEELHNRQNENHRRPQPKSNGGRRNEENRFRDNPNK